MDILKNKKVLIGIAAAVVAIILIVVIVLIANAYKTPLNNYIDIVYKAKFNKLEKMAPKEYWDWYEEEYDKSVDDLIEEANDHKDDYMEILEARYGEKIKVKSKITDKEKLDKDDLADIAEALEEKYDIKAKSVKAGYELEYEITVEGSDDKDETEGEITVIQIGMSWYAINYGKIGNTTFVSFVTGI